MPNPSLPIIDRLTGVLFGFYSTQEMRELSVCEIKNINAFDNFGRALEAGLYDERMGVSPYEKNTKCVTCGQEE
jgi:DNA-directed RNA polymerase I subunit RPA1